MVAREPILLCLLSAFLFCCAAKDRPDVLGADGAVRSELGNEGVIGGADLDAGANDGLLPGNDLD